MDNNQDLLKLMGGEKPCFSGTYAQRHELHLKGPLTGPEDYVDWIRTIRGAGPNDLIEFHINTPGGDVYTAIELLGAFESSEAHVHVIINGICASAGTILMTVGDSFEINPYTSFMFHNYSGGMRGKGNEMAIQMEYERQWSADFMHDIYKHILSEDEIKQLLDGRDFWLRAEDVGNRLSNLVDKRQEAMDEAMKLITDALEEAEKPKKKKRKTAAKKK